MASQQGDRDSNDGPGRCGSGDGPPPGGRLESAAEASPQAHGEAECGSFHPAGDAGRCPTEEQIERVDTQQLHAASDKHAAQHRADNPPGRPTTGSVFGCSHAGADPEPPDSSEESGETDENEQDGGGAEFLIDG